LGKLSGFINSYCSPNVIKIIKIRKNEFGMHETDHKCLQNFGWEPEKKIPLGRLGHRWEDYIKTDLKGTGDGVWIGFN
jgi:hypothetical protein